MLADDWWFWVLTAAAVVAIVAGEPRWRTAAVAARRAALRRRVVDAGSGRRVDDTVRGPWSEPWLPGVVTGLWVCASPWILGYDDADGAVAADAVTGAVIVAVSLLGVPFPALLTLNVLAGLWLTTAPWLVGYGLDGDLSGLSDVGAGLLTCALALRGLAVANSRLRAATPGPVGRLQSRRTE